MDGEWVSPVELRDALKKNLKSRCDQYTREQAIFSHLRAKQLAAKADVVLTNGEASGDEVLQKIWSMTRNRDDDWIRGYFAATLVDHYEGSIRYEAFRAQFSKGDAERMGANFTAASSGILPQGERLSVESEERPVGRPPSPKLVKPGPPIDIAWREKVHAYCRAAREGGVRSASQRIFLQDVKSYYQMAHSDAPVDPRRTHQFREEWLDERAKLPPQA